jgi:hypothetical protein
MARARVQDLETRLLHHPLLFQDLRLDCLAQQAPEFLEAEDRHDLSFRAL